MTSKIHVTKIDFENEYSPSSRAYISLFSIIPRYPQDQHRSNRRRVSARIMASTGANHCATSADSEAPRLAACRRRLNVSPALDRASKALRPRLHGLQHRDLALLPSAVAPHPQVELVVGSPPGSAPLSTESIRDGGSRVALHEAWHHRNAPLDILAVADVQAGNGGAACRIVEHGHTLALYATGWCKVDLLERAEEGQGHLDMALGGFESACRAQAAQEQQLQPAYNRRSSPLTSKSVAMLKASGGLGL